MTYEFPPSGGGGVQRIAKLARFLPESGWTPVVIAAEVVPGRPRDDSLLADVADVRVERTPARHVSTAISRAMAPGKSLAKGLRRTRPAPAPADGAGPAAPAGPAPAAMRGSSLSLRVSRWVAMPDDAAYWISPAVEAAVALGTAQKVAAVFASGPPFSVLVAAEKVAARLGVPLVTDMRDGWDTNPLLHYPTARHRARALSLEHSVLAASAVTIATAPSIAEEAARLGAREVRLVPNGFDADDLPPRAPDAAAPLRLAFMGRVYPGLTDPAPLVDALARAAADASPAAAAEFDLVGSWPSELEEYVAASGAGERVHFHEYRPHREALDLVSRADVGVAIVSDSDSAQGATPAKLFEYLGMGLSVLLLAPPDGFPAAVLAKTGGGVCVSPSDPAAIDAALADLAARKAAGTLPVPDAAAVARYDRRAIAREIAALLDEVVAPGA
jgi:glycosyltransferase involved in cell wall biosynthesis